MTKKTNTSSIDRKQNNPINTESLSSFFSPLLIIIAGIASYASSIDCGFHLDDFPLIVTNDYFHSLDLTKIWHYAHSRFVGGLSFALNYKLNGLEPEGYHFVNITIHLLSSLGAYLLALLIMSTPVLKNKINEADKKIFALGCGLIFAIHPLQTQAVTYIIQRYTSLSGLFYLSSLSFYLSGRLSSGPKSRILFFLCFVIMLLGLFTKESALTLPAAIVLIEIAFFYNGRMRDIFKVKAYLYALIPVIALIFLIPFVVWLRYGFSSFFVEVMSSRYQDPPLTPIVYFFTQLKVLPHYLFLMVLPLKQNVDYDIPPAGSFFEFPVMGGFVLLSAIFITGFKLFRNNRLIAFSILWFFITVSVESSFKPIKDVMVEHRMYLPLLGFSIAAMAVLQKFSGNSFKRNAVILLVILIPFYSVLTFNRNSIWKTELSLWSDTVEKSPGKVRPHNTLGVELKNSGRFKEAESEFKKALEIFPDYFTGTYNLANTFLKTGNYESSVREFTKAITLDSTYFDVFKGLGDAYTGLGKPENALDAYDKALKLAPEKPEIYYNMGTVYISGGNSIEAIANWRKAVELRPDYYEAYINMGNTYARNGEYENAAREFENALKSKPSSADAMINLGRVYEVQGDFKNALQYYEKVLGISPNSKSAQSGAARCREQINHVN